MVKHKSRRRKGGGRFQAIPFQTALGLLTLADGVVTQSTINVAFAQKFYGISADVTWVIRDATVGEGPIEVGLCHNDLTSAEIEENLQVEISDPSDIIALERSRRPVRRAGAFPLLGTDETIKHGDEVRTTLKFPVGTGHSFAMWAANRGGAALTTGAIVEAMGTIYGRWAP